MIKKLSTAVLALALAASAIAMSAPMAQATPMFEAEEYPALIDGVQTESFKFESELGSVVCKGATFTGEMSATSSSLTLAPTFKECTFAGSAATVESSGCTFVSHNLEEVAEGFESLADVACPTGATLKIHLPLGCLLTVGAQINISDIHWNLDLSIPPRLELVSQLANVQAKLEDTPGKKCFFGTKSLTLSAGGKASISARNIKFQPQGLKIK